VWNSCRLRRPNTTSSEEILIKPRNHVLYIAQSHNLISCHLLMFCKQPPRSTNSFSFIKMGSIYNSFSSTAVTFNWCQWCRSEVLSDDSHSSITCVMTSSFRVILASKPVSYTQIVQSFSAAIAVKLPSLTCVTLCDTYQAAPHPLRYPRDIMSLLRVEQDRVAFGQIVQHRVTVLPRYKLACTPGREQGGGADVVCVSFSAAPTKCAQKCACACACACELCTSFL
jgi:hypothetical protein